MNVGFISLGCSKNLVDTEMLIGLFKKNNYNIVNIPESADILVVNTCGFIASAKEEAINTILEMAEYKKKKCKYLIVMGCLVQRYKEELVKEIPEVDLFIKYKEYDSIWDQITAVISKKTDHQELNFLDRVLTTGNKTAYVRIAEGCSNRCAYCAIPYIRGNYESRKIENILEEVELLAKRGYEEIILIAQDTTKYGFDLYGKAKLPELLNEICKIKEIKWVRFLYAYPESITEELIDVVKNNEKICKYFDIPIQHISNSVLKRMNRKSTADKIYKLIEKIRNEIPNVVIRTTLMVGFPGETEDDFKELTKFISWAKFDRLGAFSFSKEEGTLAEKMEGQVHYKTKKARYEKVMKLQQNIALENSKKRIGEKLEVIIEAISKDNKYLICRSMKEVPDIDGVIYIESNNINLLNKFVKVEIIDIAEYDMIAKIL